MGMFKSTFLTHVQAGRKKKSNFRKIWYSPPKSAFLTHVQARVHLFFFLAGFNPANHVLKTPSQAMCGCSADPTWGQSIRRIEMILGR